MALVDSIEFTRKHTTMLECTLLLLSDLHAHSHTPGKMPDTHNQKTHTSAPSPPPQPPRTERTRSGLEREPAGLNRGLQIAKLSELWISYLLACGLCLMVCWLLPISFWGGGLPPPRQERRLHIFVFFFFTLLALLLFPPPPSLLYVFVRSSKVYSYPLPTVLCNKNPLWLSTSSADEKWGIYITDCLIFKSAFLFLYLLVKWCWRWWFWWQWQRETLRTMYKVVPATLPSTQVHQMPPWFRRADQKLGCAQWGETFTVLTDRSRS